MRVCALVHISNHADRVEDIVLRCRAVIEPDVLVIATGTTDGGDQIAKDNGAHVVRNDGDSGIGHPTIVGLKAAQVRGYSHAVVLDADRCCIPEEIPPMIEGLWADPEKIWVGERRCKMPGRTLMCNLRLPEAYFHRFTRRERSLMTLSSRRSNNSRPLPKASGRPKKS